MDEYPSGTSASNASGDHSLTPLATANVHSPKPEVKIRQIRRIGKIVVTFAGTVYDDSRNKESNLKHKSGSKSQELRRNLAAVLLLLALCNTGFTDWQDAAHRAVLTNKTMEVRFQAGFVFSLTDRLTQNHLLSIGPSELPSRMLIFDATPTDLNKCEVNTEITEGSVTTTFILPGGDQWRLEWSIEAGQGDLALRATARTSNPVEFLRYSFFGCDIA